MWPSGVSRKKIESHPKVSDAGLSAPVIGTSRTSIAESPESVVNILTTRMPDYRGSGASRSRGEAWAGSLPTLSEWAKAFHLLYGRLLENILLHLNRNRACPKRRAGSGSASMLGAP